MANTASVVHGTHKRYVTKLELHLMAENDADAQAASNFAVNYMSTLTHNPPILYAVALGAPEQHDEVTQDEEDGERKGDIEVNHVTGDVKPTMNAEENKQARPTEASVQQDVETPETLAQRDTETTLDEAKPD